MFYGGRSDSPLKGFTSSQIEVFNRDLYKRGIAAVSITSKKTSTENNEDFKQTQNKKSKNNGG